MLYNDDTGMLHDFSSSKYDNYNVHIANESENRSSSCIGNIPCCLGPQHQEIQRLAWLNPRDLHLKEVLKLVSLSPPIVSGSPSRQDKVSKQTQLYEERAALGNVKPTKERGKDKSTDFYVYNSSCNDFTHSFL